ALADVVEYHVERNISRPRCGGIKGVQVHEGRCWKQCVAYVILLLGYQFGPVYDPIVEAAEGRYLEPGIRTRCVLNKNHSIGRWAALGIIDGETGIIPGDIVVRTRGGRR